MRKPTPREVLIVCCVVPLAVVVFMVLGNVWEMHRVNKLCAALTPGTILANVQPTIRKFSLWNSLVA